MTSDQLFRILILVTLAANAAISIYFRRQADKQGGKLDPSGNRVLLFLRLGALVVLGPLIGFLINTDWMGWARYSSPDWLRWIGFALTTISIPCLYWLFSTIGKNISPTHATRESHQLITDGPYRFVRHPLYTVGFAIFLGIGLMATMWWLLVGLGILFVVIAWRTRREEENLLHEFGEKYRSYMNRTGRYLPKLFR
ncbi:MAG: methyltransferase family protein [Pirellulaceae bacterium]